MEFKNIVILSDFSEHAAHAFRYALNLATHLKADLHILHVQEESSLRIAIKEGLIREDSTDEQITEAVEELINERLAQMTGSIDRSRVNVVIATRRGDPKSVAVSFASEIKADIVVVGRRGAGLIEDIRSAVLGSVAESVIRKSPCPVLVVRRDHWG
jgi:nucleotide-binding universal stress UspA family protein